MKGADEYHDLFKKTHQKGKLYFVVSSHARGKTFRVFTIPNGEDAMPNCSHNPPLNSGSVEVYGVISGNLGWTETYGWIHEGKWQDDFNSYVEVLKIQSVKLTEDRIKSQIDRDKKDKEKLESNLSNY